MVHKEFMSKRELKAYEKMEAEVIRLNNEFPVGEPVLVRMDNGENIQDVIKHPFSIMSGSVVAWLETKGSYLAERVHMLPF